MDVGLVKMHVMGAQGIFKHFMGILPPHLRPQMIGLYIALNTLDLHGEECADCLLRLNGIPFLTQRVVLYDRYTSHHFKNFKA